MLSLPRILNKFDITENIYILIFSSSYGDGRKKLTDDELAVVVVVVVVVVVDVVVVVFSPC